MEITTKKSEEKTESSVIASLNNDDYKETKIDKTRENTIRKQYEEWERDETLSECSK